MAGQYSPLMPTVAKGCNTIAALLSGKTAAAVYDIFQKTDICELIVEGGSTASAICRHLQFRRFFPVIEIARGVVRMKVQEKHNLYLTVKPGSYDWPGTLWNF